MTITTITLNSINYISYASVAEADALLAIDPTRATAWDLLSDDEKGANLVAATNRLDLVNYRGEKEVSTQDNQWARIGTDCDGNAFPSGDVPTGMANGTSLLAGSITLDPTNANAGTSGTNTKKVKAGSASVEFFRSSTGVPIQDATVWGLIKCFTEAGVAGGVSTTASFGTDVPSQTPIEDDYGRTEGFA